MPNREKVIERLEYCAETRDDYVRDCINDALALLKEQETTLEKDGHHVRCLNCGEYWCNNDREGNPFPMNFCPNCGRKVKWND
jgi:hypothetical protein